MKIAIIGAGAFGTALGGVLVENGHEVKYYDPKDNSTTLASAVDFAENIILAVPSSAVDSTLPELPVEKPLIVATKGVLSDQIFNNFADVMVVSGPGFADDIKNHQKTILTATDQRIIELFSTDYLTFDFTADRRGVLMCGALKNVYALYAGFLGLIPGTPGHVAYLENVTTEMQTILAANGADAATVELACGRGDLEITCDFPSRNYEFGMGLRKNPEAKTEKTVEGMTALEKIKNGAIIIPDGATNLKELMELSNQWGCNGIKR